MSKIIIDFAHAKEKIKNAVNLIADPVIQTLSPKGLNVLYEDRNGGLFNTNDGVTIAKQIESDDEIENVIINAIKHASLRTNREAGDGTTTTILFTKSLVLDGIKLVEDGMNPMILRDHLQAFGRKLKDKIRPIEVTNDEQLFNIAKISANNDEEIAGHVLRVIQVAGDSGMVFIDPSTKEQTEILEDTGFTLSDGLFLPDFAQNNGFSATLEDVPVFVTDKRIYYEQEAEEILSFAVEKLGTNKLVVIARDFIGKSLNVFAANHNRGAIQLMLIKDSQATEKDSSTLLDLATYLGGELVTEKAGKLVGNVKPEYFVTAKKVFANRDKTVIVSGDTEKPKLKERIEQIKKALEDDKDDKDLEKRLAALTTGTVTIKVAGATQIETTEKIFRYEDAINAARAAKKYGYLVGGGLAMYGAFDPTDYPQELVPMFRRFCEASIRQIAKNCGEHEETILKGSQPMFGDGYNAKTGKFENLLSAGVIDPYKVTTMAIENSISIAQAILTSNYFIVTKKEKQDERSDE